MQVGRSGVITLLAAVAIAALSCQTVYAARYLRINILIDNKVVLESGTGDNGSADADTVWNYLKEVKFESAGTYQVRPDANDETRATLKGAIKVDVRYGGEATVKELKLIRDKQDKAKWIVDPAEVDRMFKIRKKPR